MVRGGRIHSRGRGGYSRDGRGRSRRPPFKSRNNFRGRGAYQKRPYDHEDGANNVKKQKIEVEECPEANFSSSSDESEPEYHDMDSHCFIMESFAGGTANDAIDSEQESDEESDDEEGDDALSDDERSVDEEGSDEEGNDENDEEERDEEASDEEASDEEPSDEERDDKGEGVEEDDDYEGSENELDESHKSIEMSGNESKDQDMTNLLKKLPKKQKKSKLSTQVALAEDAEAQVDDSELPSDDDPFCLHFERNISAESAARVQDTTAWTTQRHTFPTIGSIKYDQPKAAPRNQPKHKLRLVEDELEEPLIGGEITPCTNTDQFNMSDYFIKDNIKKNVTQFTDLQKQLLPILTNYHDLYYPESTYDKWDDITKLYSIHIVSHILKTRTRILKNNAKLEKAKLTKAEYDPNVFKDQGYARPKVLLLVPSRHSAFRAVESMIEVLGLKGHETVVNRRRFTNDFGPGDTSANSAKKKKKRPPDHAAFFAGDMCDNFKIGLTITKKAMRLYVSFYQCDVVIASPLGLRLTAGVDGEAGNDTGFLTSLEMLILDQADVFFMQNWEHVATVWESLNLAPRTVAEINTDVTRVRPWLVSGHGRLYRQTLVFSSTLLDQHRALFLQARNIAGRVQVYNPPTSGVLASLLVSAEVVLCRGPGYNDSEARLQYFIKEFLPRHMDSKKSFTLVFIPDYCDYMALNHHLSSDRGIAFSSINEHMTSKMSHVAVARSDFFKGESLLLLYTERFHFYKRPTIKGVRHLVFYALPTYAHFFTELCNMMAPRNQNKAAPREQRRMRPSVTVLYQKSDVTRLTAVLGTRNARAFLASDKTVHTCTVQPR